jgi:hypothetical protein
VRLNQRQLSAGQPEALKLLPVGGKVSRLLERMAGFKEQA